MMNLKKIFIIIIIIFIGIFFTLFYFLTKSEKTEQISKFEEESISEKVRELYLDAPKPDMDIEEVLKLWPDLKDRPRQNPEDVEREWLDFYRKYPNNFYIPTKYLNLTEEQLQERQKQLEIFADLEARFASIKAKYKKITDTSIQGPEAPKEPTITPEEQRQFFNYKIHELQSRIELVEYWIENQKEQIDPQQMEIANQDLAEWKKELEEYKKLLKEIP